MLGVATYSEFHEYPLPFGLLEEVYCDRRGPDLVRPPEVLEATVEALRAVTPQDARV